MLEDSESLARLIDGYRGVLTAVARSRGLDHHAAEDCVQDVSLRAMSMTFTQEDIEPLLKRMVRNRALDILRSTQSREARQRLVGSRTLVEHADPFATVLDQAEARWLMRRLTALRPREQQLAQLVAQGLEVQEAGRTLGLSPKNTSVTWSRASAAMRALVASASAVLVWARRHVREGAAGTTVLASAIAALTIPHIATPLDPGTADRPPPYTAGQQLESEPSTLAIRQAPQPAQKATVPGQRAGARASEGEGAPQRSLALVPKIETPVVGSRGPVTTERRREEETFYDSVFRCVEQGVVITLGYQGCAG
ncbi:MAG: sigma-70 family RNA polymerase sigma factor [Mycobacteriales bacterium]|nr:sigma-70 family RNA polymerase sigma factor [Mycobacteriales bacterium]